MYFNEFLRSVGKHNLRQWDVKFPGRRKNVGDWVTCLYLSFTLILGEHQTREGSPTFSRWFCRWFWPFKNFEGGWEAQMFLFCFYLFLCRNLPIKIIKDYPWVHVQIPPTSWEWKLSSKTVHPRTITVTGSLGWCLILSISIMATCALPQPFYKNSTSIAKIKVISILLQKTCRTFQASELLPKKHGENFQPKLCLRHSGFRSYWRVVGMVTRRLIGSLGNKMWKALVEAR